MRTVLVGCALVLSLASCKPDEIEDRPIKGLEDCLRISTEFMTVFRCPLSETTTITGSRQTAVVNTSSIKSSLYQYDTLYLKFDGSMLIRRIDRYNYDTIYTGSR